MSKLVTKRPTDIRMVSPMVLRMDMRTDHRHFRIQKEKKKRNGPKVGAETKIKNLEVFREQSRGSAGPPLLPVRITYFRGLTDMLKSPFSSNIELKHLIRAIFDMKTSFSTLNFVKVYSFSLKYLGFQFKKWLTFNSNVNSSWKQEALNGDYEYVGMSKFDEPYFKRSYGGKDVFLSLWGPEGKRKWRIGPDVNTKGKVFSLIHHIIWANHVMYR